MALLCVHKVQVQGEDALYPDFSCHPGYNPRYGRLHPDDIGKDGWYGNLESINDFACKNTECPKFCIIQYVRIADRSGKLDSEDRIAEELEKYFDLNENDSAKKIANKIVSDCGEIGLLVKAVRTLIENPVTRLVCVSEDKWIS
ncbi:unnamed protein product [Orchesella dallaii]|uniref:Uncharacterized protein n=1 Tax=Orchesella dallaii TaxID=48710 RepID=A0ABP1RX18_9HEXA